MTATVFTEIKFWLLILFSVVLPFGIYAVLMAKRAVSRRTVLFFGLVLVLVAGVNVYLLQSLAAMVRETPSLVDKGLFSSEISLALYLLPAMFGGVGINVISHVLVAHLSDAEKESQRKHPDG